MIFTEYNNPEYFLKIDDFEYLNDLLEFRIKAKSIGEMEKFNKFAAPLLNNKVSNNITNERSEQDISNLIDNL